MDTKFCTRCKTHKPANQFTKKGPEKFQPWCTPCRNARRKELALRPEFQNITEKLCKDCHRFLPISAFHRSNIMRDGYQARCAACHKLKYGVGTVEWNEQRKKSYSTWDGWKRRALSGAKKRAAEIGVPFSITAADIIIPPDETCPVLGIKFSRGTKGFLPNAPSLDKIVPSLGYVVGNISVISYMANKIKSDVTNPAILEQVAAYMRKTIYQSPSNGPIPWLPKAKGNAKLNKALWILGEEMARLKSAA